MMTKKRSAEKTVRDIRRATRRHYSAEEKIRIVLEKVGSESKADLETTRASSSLPISTNAHANHGRAKCDSVSQISFFKLLKS